MNSCTLAVKVIPGASRDELCGWEGETVKIKLSAPPVEGRANQALIEFLAGKLDCPRRMIGLVRGATARRKWLQVEGLSLDEVKARLGAIG